MYINKKIYIIRIVISLLLGIVISWGIYNIINSDLSDKNSKIDNKINKNFTEGLHYIGQINKPRIFHSVFKINDNDILIVGGCSKKEQTINSSQYVQEQSAEIFNLIDLSSKYTKQHPYYPRHSNTFRLSKNKVLFTGNNLEIYNINSEKFFKYNPQYASNNIEYSDLKDNKLMQCSNAFSSDVSCELVNLKTNNIEKFINKFRPKPEFEAYYTGHKKINDKLLLFYQIFYYAKQEESQNMAIGIFDINKKEFISSNIINNIGLYNRTSEPVVIDDNNILFLGGVRYPFLKYKCNDECSENKGIYQKSKLYNIKDNKVIKELDYLYNDINIPIKGIKLSNGNILIIEGSKIRQLYNIQKMEFESIGPYQIDSINSQIINLDENFLLIIGGENTETNEISKSVWLYVY